MSDTPRTEAMKFLLDSIREEDAVVSADFARKLERELSAAKYDRDQWKVLAGQQSNDLKQLRDALGCDGSDLPQLLAAIEKLRQNADE